MGIQNVPKGLTIFFSNNVTVILRGSYLSQEILLWKLQTDKLLGTGTLSWTGISPEQAPAGPLVNSAVHCLCCVSLCDGAFLWRRWKVRAKLTNLRGDQNASHMAKIRCSHDSHRKWFRSHMQVAKDEEIIFRECQRKSISSTVLAGH